MAGKFNSGNVWSEVRQSRSQNRERLIAAFDSEQYEKESALLDDIARKITKNIEPMISEYVERDK